MEKDNTKQLQIIAKMLNPDRFITADDISAIRDAVFTLLSNFKKGNEELNADTKKEVEDILKVVSIRQKELYEDIKDGKKELIALHKEQIDEIAYLAEEIKNMAPKPGEKGKDADEEKIVGRIYAMIEANKNQTDVESDDVEITGEQVIDMINGLDYTSENLIDIKRIKGWEKFFDNKNSNKAKGFQPTVLTNAMDLDTSARANGYAIVWDSTTGMHKYAASAGSPGGSDTQIQFNDGGVFAGDSGLTFNKTTKKLDLGGDVQLNAGGYIYGDTTSQYLRLNSTLGVFLAYATNSVRIGSSRLQLWANNAEKVSLTATGLGFLTTSPTHTLTLGSTSTGISLYNTADQTTNYERGLLYWNSNALTITTQKAGSGTSRTLVLGSALGNTLTLHITPTSGQFLFAAASTATVSAIHSSFTGTINATSGTQYGISLTPTINQSSTAGYTALLVNPTETTTGSGSKLLADFQVGGVSKLTISNGGVIVTSSGDIRSSTAVYLQATSSSIYLRPTSQSQNNALRISAGTNGTKLDLYSSAAANSGVENIYYNGVGILQSDADFRLTTAGTNTASIVTVGGTQALTGKKLTLAAGTATAGTAPLKFTSGVNLTTAEAGAMEYDGTWAYFTLAGTTRRTFVFADTIQTITNKRNQPRVYTATNNASLTPEIDTYDVFHLTAMSANTTINNKSTSTPSDGEQMRFRFLDNGTSRTLSWGTDYVAKAGVALPTATTIGKNLIVLYEWNANLSKWNCLASGLEV